MTGITGRKPDPTALRLLKNDKAHTHRHKNKVEPLPSEERPMAPDYLSARAKEIFEDFVNRVEEMYPVSETDMDIIVLYANNKEQLEHYEFMLRTEGSTFDVWVLNKKGESFVSGVRARPEVSMLKECKAMQLNILREFGLSPSSRTRVNIKPKKKEKLNPFAVPGSKKKTK